MMAAPSIALGVTGAEANSRSAGNVVTSGVLEGELESFMEREAANPELVNFAGGNPVIIVLGSTALLIILVVVLVVMLLT